MTSLSRRDFLKLATAFSTSAYLSSLGAQLQGTHRKKVLILLFDTMSARHLSLYGYPRETSPYLSQFASQSTVFHSHYSASNFTTPATAAMLLGIDTWNHRAYNVGGVVRRDLAEQNIFALLGEESYRVSFAQTVFANVLLQQFLGGMDRNLPPTSFSVSGSRFFTDHFLHEKTLTPFLFEDFATHILPDMPGTLLGGYISSIYQLRHKDYLRYGFPEYPRGLPLILETNIGFKLEDVFAGVYEEVKTASANPRPHFSYYHLYAPHEPSRPHQDFLKLFRDDYRPVEKPDHPLGEGFKYKDLVGKQLLYDRYITNVDHEFGLLMERLDKEHLLDDTYVVVTSDHGQLFERSFYGHGGALMYDSLVHIPLVIRAPGQTSRQDIHTRTSNIDLVPTLLTLLGLDVPENVDGRLLPGFGGAEDPSRAIYSVVSPRSSAFRPMKGGTFAMQQGSHKLIYYKNYSKYPNVTELYNIDEDPDELNDLNSELPQVTKQMMEQLTDAIETADQPFR